MVAQAEDCRVAYMRLHKAEVEHLQAMIALVQKSIGEQKRGLLHAISAEAFGRPV